MNGNGDWFWGADPGTRYFGWAVIHHREKKSHLGRIILPSGQPIAERLWFAHYEIARLMKKFPPISAGMERSFFNPKAPQAAVILGRAQGVFMVLAHAFGAPVLEYPPHVVKKRMAGKARASKPEVVAAVHRIRKGKKPSEDAADAFSVAWSMLATLEEIGVDSKTEVDEIRKKILERGKP